MKKKLSEQATIKGTVAHITFRNSENWAVFIVHGSIDIGDVNCTGILPEMCDKSSVVTCIGTWERGKYGKQLKCNQIIPAPPDIDSKKGVVALLYRLPGIGQVKALRAVKEYGHELAWKAAVECPSMLGIVGLGAALKAQQKALSMVNGVETTVYLLGLGLTDYQCNKIIMRYGAENAVRVISENPYQLMKDIDGFGFLTIDKIAIKAGMKLNNSARIMACCLFCLLSSEINNGNIYIWGKELVDIVKNELAKSSAACRVSMKNLNGMSIGYEMVRKCIYGLQHEEKVFIEGGKVYSKKLLDAEKIILEKLEGETKH